MRAGATFQAYIWAGKFQGNTAPTTPMGSCTISPKAALPVGATLPNTLSAASAYHSKVSIVAGMSVFKHSVIGLPASTQSNAASSSKCSCMSAHQRCIIALRSAGARRRHSPFSKASRATCTAVPTSSLVPEAI